MSIPPWFTVEQAESYRVARAKAGDTSDDCVVKIYIEVPGEPVAKGRPRFMRNGHTYTPEKTTRWEHLAILAASLDHDGPPLPWPLKVRLTAFFQTPASWPLWRKQEAEAGNVVHTSKPDADNLAKIVGDALNGVVWIDDAQIVDMSVRKYYSNAPRVEICVDRVLSLTGKSLKKEMNF